MLAGTKLDTKCAMIYPTDFCHHICPDFHYSEPASLSLLKMEIVTASCSEPEDCSGLDLAINSICDLGTSSQRWKETRSLLVVFMKKSRLKAAHFWKFVMHMNRIN